MRLKIASILFVLMGAGMMLMPLWADSTPVYPPILGTLLLGPITIVSGVCMWTNR